MFIMIRKKNAMPCLKLCCDFWLNAHSAEYYINKIFFSLYGIDSGFMIINLLLTAIELITKQIWRQDSEECRLAGNI